MANPDPSADVAAALVTSGTVSLLDPPSGTVAVGIPPTSPGNVLVGREREKDPFVSNQIINVVSTGGPAPEPIMNGGGSIYRARVQVMVRSQVDHYDEGRALARACLRKLHLATISGYTDVMAQETEPNYLGPDERQVERWSFNLLLRWVE